MARRALGAILAALQAGMVHAHPGHGAELLHAHGELLAALVLVALLVAIARR